MDGVGAGVAGAGAGGAAAAPAPDDDATVPPAPDAHPNGLVVPFGSETVKLAVRWNATPGTRAEAASDCAG